MPKRGGWGQRGGAVSSRSFDLLNSMIYDLKRSVDLRWLFDPVLLFILRWFCSYEKSSRFPQRPGKYWKKGEEQPPPSDRRACHQLFNHLVRWPQLLDQPQENLVPAVLECCTPSTPLQSSFVCFSAVWRLLLCLNIAFFFIGPKSDNQLPLSLTDSQTPV